MGGGYGQKLSEDDVACKMIEGEYYCLSHLVIHNEQGWKVNPKAYDRMEQDTLRIAVHQPDSDMIV
jgi:hypothetical protein